LLYSYSFLNLSFFSNIVPQDLISFCFLSGFGLCSFNNFFFNHFLSFFVLQFSP
jgi:hypothetical protein